MSARLTQEAVDALILQPDYALADVEAALRGGFPVDATDSNGSETLLHWAARRGQLPITHLLLSHGASPNRVNRWGATPLWTAAYRGTPEVLQALIDAGGNVNVRDRDGYTVLMAVVCWTHGDAEARLRVLLSRQDLDLNATGGLGVTAAVLADTRGRTDMAAAIVEEVGARVPSRMLFSNHRTVSLF